MAGVTKTHLQLGDNNTAANNFMLTSQAADGTMKLARGNNGTTTQDILTVNAAGLITMVNGEILTVSKIQSGISQAATSGTSITFTGIPSWAKRITLMLNGVSKNSTSPIRVRIGSGSVEATGYLGMALRSLTGGAVGTASITAGFDCAGADVAASTNHGMIILTLVSANTWSCVLNVGLADASTMNTTTGTKTTAGALDRISLTSVNGTDTFTAGSVNIFYE